MIFCRAILLSLSFCSFSLVASSEKTQLDQYYVLEQTEKRFNEFESRVRDSLPDSGDVTQKEIKKIVEESNLLFLSLRQKVREIFFTEWGNHPFTNTEAIYASSEMTNWYVSYLEAILFLEDSKQ